ncbi:MAG TPA: FKBP-type peptidyl-prolyl cis-trans isomerase [Alphaproteobacteria bacterium]|nr:FKBP-type peptidyl-prolyl cis-trans isomerase [Alphaproteobacteria bacterium]
MAQANTGDTVRIHYSGKLKDGTLFDSSEGRDPLEITIGDKKVIPAIEESVVGLSVGDTTTVEVEAANAFGPHRPEAIQKVERSAIPEGVDVTVGSQVQATGTDGQQLILKVVEVDDATVTLDGNHPLAGEDLVFEIELTEIVEPVG